MRRRWVVLLVGTARLATGHRSELSRHRTLESARAAALDAESRLREGPIATARDYVVAIERDGEPVPIHDVAPSAPSPDATGDAAGTESPGAPSAHDEAPDDAQEATVDADRSAGRASEPTPAAADESHAADGEEQAKIIVPGRYVPEDVERGLRDQDGRELPGPGPVPEEMIRDWEAKVARLEGDPTAGDGIFF